MGDEFHLFHLVGADWGSLLHARRSFQSFKCGGSCWEAQPWIEVLVRLVNERKLSKDMLSRKAVQYVRQRKVFRDLSRSEVISSGKMSWSTIPWLLFQALFRGFSHVVIGPVSSSALIAVSPLVFLFCLEYTLLDVFGWTEFVPQGFLCLYKTCMFSTHFGPFLKLNLPLSSHCEQRPVGARHVGMPRVTLVTTSPAWLCRFKAHEIPSPARAMATVGSTRIHVFWKGFPDVPKYG